MSERNGKETSGLSYQDLLDWNKELLAENRDLRKKVASYENVPKTQRAQYAKLKPHLAGQLNNVLEAAQEYAGDVGLLRVKDFIAWCRETGALVEYQGATIGARLRDLYKGGVIERIRMGLYRIPTPGINWLTQGEVSEE